MPLFYIYALVDPRTEEPRYVGQTCRSLHKRFTEHTRDRRATYKHNWIKQLARQGHLPRLSLLYTCYDVRTADAAEIFFIADFKNRGFALTNYTLGGLGGSRGPMTQEHKDKIRAKALGRKMSSASIEKTRAALAGRKLSEQTIAKMRMRTFSPETRAKLRAARKTRVFSAETREKIRLANLGRKHTEQTKIKMKLAKKKYYERLTATGGLPPKV